MRIFSLNFLLSTLLISNPNMDLLNHMLDDELWEFVKQDDDFEIYEKNNNNDKMVLIKKETNLDKDIIFSTIKNVEGYSEILTSQNVLSEFLGMNNSRDTLYGYQKYINFMPFIRDRQIVYKMFDYKDKIVWVLLNKKDRKYEDFKSDGIKTLYKGVGSWEYIEEDNKNYIIHRFCMDTELNIPEFMLSNARRNSVKNVMNDVINYGREVENE